MGKKYKIHEVAKILGISSSAIRFYEKKGLFHAKKEERNGYRYYEQDDINKIWSIIYHRTIDMSLDRIDDFKQLDSLSQKREMVRQQKALKESRIVEETKVLKIWDFYDKLIGEILDIQDVPLATVSAPLHLFNRSFMNNPHSSVYRVCMPATVFSEEPGEMSSAAVYMMVHEKEYQELLTDEDRSREIERVPPFSCIHTIIQDSSDYDDTHVLRKALKVAGEQGYIVCPPYYVIYMLSSGGWENNQRYYEVFMCRKQD